MAVRLGELLLREKRVTPTQLQEALTFQRANGGRLGTTLVKLGFLKDEDVTEILSRQYGVPAIDLRDFELDASLVRLIPGDTAAKYNVIPVTRTGNTLTLAMTDPTNVFAMDDIKFRTGLHVEPVVASDSAIREAITKYFGNPSSANGGPGGGKSMEIVNKALEDLNLDGQDEIQVVDSAEEIDAASLERQSGEAPVIRLANALFLAAIQRGASDIHIEPYEKDLRVRFRIDGVLQSVMTPPLKFRDPLVSRIKIMARLDIAEKRLPQDGRIKARFNDRGQSREIDFRVSVLPTLFGEKIVLRLLDAKGLRLDMTQLGFEPEALERFERAIHKPWGMVLVTGPTGSGKTNTLYSALSQLNQPGVNIMTAEDPVEFNLSGINQVLVREQIGLTFAGALRSFLRQDPNIILVGEIRDSETAGIAVKAALTGHLVLSTLHTNDAPSTINRLVNMGIEPFLVANSINLIAAQRLVRRICEACREPYEVPPETLIEAGLPESEVSKAKTMKGRGCDRCSGTGYKGRLGLFEIMEVSEAMRDLIVSNATIKDVRDQALSEGMSPLRRSGMLKVRDGITTIEEVARETM
ncbi:MAG TPA: type IV-A pilus assembly ATPase PilB [Vicinamibacterales bacterium]|nr:type IV-A pilus assembly ATPase PilB [Vicinamibacterales bacterium]